MLRLLLLTCAAGEYRTEDRAEYGASSASLLLRLLLLTSATSEDGASETAEDRAEGGVLLRLLTTAKDRASEAAEDITAGEAVSAFELTFLLLRLLWSYGASHDRCGEILESVGVEGAVLVFRLLGAIEHGVPYRGQIKVFHFVNS